MYQEVNINGERIATKSLTGRIAIAGGTSDYNQLENKPSINNVELSGNKTTSELGINIPTKTSDLNNDSGYITSAALTGYCKQTVTPAIGAGTTYDFTNFSDGAIIYVYRPSDQTQADYTGIFIRATNWNRLIPIKSVANVSVSGYILTNNTSAALRCVVIST